MSLILLVRLKFQKRQVSRFHKRTDVAMYLRHGHQCRTPHFVAKTISKSKMILRRLGGGDEAYYKYIEEADNDANKNSALI